MPIRVELPSFAFDYNYQYNGTYVNTGNASKYYPSYNYMNLNSNVNREAYPAFVKNAKAGVVGQGICFYGYTSSASSEIPDANWVDISHVWSQAIPVTFSTVIGLFWFNVYFEVYNNSEPEPNIFTRSYSSNMGFFVNYDHRLSFGGYNYPAYFPMTAVNYQLDMTPYMYTPAVQPTDPYAGHTYCVTYNAEGDALELFVDNTNTKLASITMNEVMDAMINIFEYYHTWDSCVNAYRNYGGRVINIYASGPGMYFHNRVSPTNFYTQGNVYFSDWYGYMPNMSLEELNGIMQGDINILPAPKNYSYYGIMADCNKLETISLPGSLNIIPNNFIGGNNLSRVVMHEGITTIGNNAINSRVNLEVEVPQTAVNMSANCIKSTTRVTVNKISYNAIQRGLMFSTACNEQSVGRYESVTGINIISMPTEYFRPLQNIPGQIEMIAEQADITTLYTAGYTDSEQADNTLGSSTYAVNYSNINVAIEFNQEVNQNVHSNSVGWVPFNITEDGFQANVFSREFPGQAHTIRQFSFINTGGFITTRRSVPAVDIIGHTNGNFEYVPELFSNHYIVNSINIAASSASLWPSTVNIHVPVIVNNYNYYTNDMTLFEALTINNLSDNVTDVYISNGDTVVVNVNNSMTRSDINYTFYNVNRVIVDTGGGYAKANINDTFTFMNCNETYIWCSRNMFMNIYDLANLSALPSANVLNRKDEAWPTDIVFNNFYVMTSIWGGRTPNTPRNCYPGIHRSDILDWLQVNLPLVYTNNYRWTDDEYLAYEGGAIYSTYGTFGNFANISLPGNMTLNNMIGRHPIFVNTSGNCNVFIGGTSTPGIYADSGKPFLFYNHANLDQINFYVSVNRAILFNAKYSGGVNEPIGKGSQLRLAAYSNIGQVVIELKDEIPMSETFRHLVYAAQWKGWTVEFLNCNIDYLEIGPNIGLNIVNCNINTINYSGGPVHFLNITNSNIYSPIQPILNNLWNTCNIENVHLADRELTIPFNATGWMKHSASLCHMNLSYLHDVTQISIIDKINVRTAGIHYYDAHCVSDMRENDPTSPGNYIYYPDKPDSYYRCSHIYYSGLAGFSYQLSVFTSTRWTNSSLLPPQMQLVIDTPEYINGLIYTNYNSNLVDKDGTVIGDIVPLSAIYMSNTVAIGNGVFEVERNGTPVPVETYHHCSVHPNCNKDYYGYMHPVNIQPNTSAPYVVGFNVNYFANRDTARPPGAYESIRNMFSLNVVYNDGTEAQTDEFEIWPDFAYMSPNRRAFHHIQLKNVCGVIPAPYNYYYVNMPTTANQYNSYTTASSVSDLMFYDKHLDYNVSCIYATPTGSSTSRGNISTINYSSTNIDTLIIRGNYNNGTQRNPHNVLDLNNGRNNARTYPAALNIMVQNVNWQTGTTASFKSFSSGYIVMLSSGRPYMNRVFGCGSFNYTNVRQIYAPFMYDNINGARNTTFYGIKYINANAIVNCNSLYHIDFNYFTGASLYINANAFQNLPLLQYLTLPPNTKLIGNNAFSTTGLKEVKIPTGCTVSTDAFPADCTITYY